MLTQDKNKSSKLSRSYQLTDEDMEIINKHAKKFNTKERAAEDLGINRGTYSDLLAKGTCSEQTYLRIIEKAKAA